MLRFNCMESILFNSYLGVSFKELVILELVFTQKKCTFRFISADYIGPVDSRGMVIEKEVSVKI